VRKLGDIAGTAPDQRQFTTRTFPAANCVDDFSGVFEKKQRSNTSSPVALEPGPIAASQFPMRHSTNVAAFPEAK
jgi:hypothetical protein